LHPTGRRGSPTHEPHAPADRHARALDPPGPFREGHDPITGAATVVDHPRPIVDVGRPHRCECVQALVPLGHPPLGLVAVADRRFDALLLASPLWLVGSSGELAGVPGA
jgi:hypothetical protein